MQVPEGGWRHKGHVTRNSVYSPHISKLTTFQLGQCLNWIEFNLIHSRDAAHKSTSGAIQRLPMYVNVCECNWYYISWQGHHDRVMQLNWLYICGICQMMPLKVWPNTALGCNHQSICMPQLQPLCSAALVPNVLPRRDGGSGEPCAVIEASILVPTQESGFEPGRPDLKS